MRKNFACEAEEEGENAREELVEVNMNKVVNRETRIRIKNINSGESINFSTRIDSARFFGLLIGDIQEEEKGALARVFVAIGKEYMIGREIGKKFIV